MSSILEMKAFDFVILKIQISTCMLHHGRDIHLMWVKSTMVHTARLVLCFELKLQGATSKLLMRSG